MISFEDQVGAVVWMAAAEGDVIEIVGDKDNNGRWYITLRPRRELEKRWMNPGRCARHDNCPLYMCVSPTYPRLFKFYSVNSNFACGGEFQNCNWLSNPSAPSPGVRSRCAAARCKGVYVHSLSTVRFFVEFTWWRKK
jgi:hypothetical protein